MDNLNTFFKKFAWKSEGSFFSFGSSPDADWKIIFISTISLAILICAFNFYFFMKINGGEAVVAEEALESNLALNVDELRRVVDYYQQKDLEFGRIKNTTSTIGDPSL